MHKIKDNKIVKTCCECDTDIGMIRCDGCKKNICHNCSYHYGKSHLCKSCYVDTVHGFDESGTEKMNEEVYEYEYV